MHWYYQSDHFFIISKVCYGICFNIEIYLKTFHKIKESRKFGEEEENDILQTNHARRHKPNTENLDTKIGLGLGLEDKSKDTKHEDTKTDQSAVIKQEHK
jgi:hypothetical protein